MQQPLSSPAAIDPCSYIAAARLVASQFLMYLDGNHHNHNGG